MYRVPTFKSRGGGGGEGGAKQKHRHTNWRGSMLICGAGGFSRLNSILDDISNLRGSGGGRVPTAVQVPSIAGGIGLKSLQHGVERGTYCVFDVCSGWASESLWAGHWGGGLVWNSCSLGLDPGGVHMYSG